MIWEIDDQTPKTEGLDAEGRADPAYAASLGLIPARPGSRVLAALVEWLLAALLLLPAVLAVIPIAMQAVTDGFDSTAFFARKDLVWIIVAIVVSAALTNIYIVVQLILHGRKGVTVGKAIFGIRSVNSRTLERPKFWRGAFVRYLLAYASFIVPLLGPLFVIALSPLFDVERRGRGWLDLVAGTWFVDVRRGLHPYDQKRMRIARKRVKTPEHEGSRALPSLATPVNRDAPAEYTPSARLSGGVIGVTRAPEAPAAAGAGVPAPINGMVSAVPPSLATGAPMAVSAASFAPPAQHPAPHAPPAAAPVIPPAAFQPVQQVASPQAPPAQTVAPLPQVMPPVTPPPAAAVGVRAVLVLDSGERFEIRGTTLFGRAPDASPGDGDAQVVRVHDDTRSVSKTHLAVVPARRGVFAMDRASTNGSAIVRGGSEVALVPGQPIELRLGDTLRFGDRVLQVEWL